MKLEDVDEARASWMKLEMVCIQLCQGAVSAWCTDKPCIVDSVPDHMVVVALQKLAAFIPVVVQEPKQYPYMQNKQEMSTSPTPSFHERTDTLFHTCRSQ